jgi:hypothetical protein
LGSNYRLVKTRKIVPDLQGRLNSLKNTSPDAYGKFQGRLDVYAHLEPPIGKAEFQQLLVLRGEIDRAAQWAPTDLLLGLQAVHDVHKKAASHNARYVRNVEQARSAALRIVGADGKLVLSPAQDFNDLPTVQGEIAVSPEQDLPQSAHALKMLEKLQGRPELQEVIQSIKAPDPNGPASGMIRSVLGLPADFPVGKAEARRAAVASLLTKLRQHDVASCFATSVAIQAQEKIPDVFLNDIKSLIETGTVVRSKTEPTKAVTVPRVDSKLHEAPAFQKALDVLGVPETEREGAISAALAELRKGLDPNLREDRFTPAQVLAAVRKAHPGDDNPDVLKAAYDAYREDGKVVMPLNPDASRSDLTSQVAIPRAGGKFHETPAIMAALNAFGIPVAAMEKTVNDALDSLRGGLDKSLTEDLFTPEQVLDKIAALRGVRDVDKSKQELDAAKQAFQAQQENALLRAWEYTVASMAELGENQGMAVREPTYLAGEKAIFGLGATLKAEGNEAGVVDKFLKDVYDKFDALFREQVAIRYDASVVTPKSADGNSSAGIWVMRRKKDDSKVNDQASQEKLVKDLLADVEKEFQGTPQEDWAKRVLLPSGEKPFTAAELKTAEAWTIARVKRANEERTLSDGPPPQPTGAFVEGTEELIAAFFNNPEPVAFEVKQPKDGTDLLAWMVDQTKALADTSQSEIPGAATVPITGGPHAFSMKAGSPGLRALTDGVKNGKTAQDVVKDYADKHKGTKDTLIPLDLDNPNSQIMQFVAKTCAGMDASWADIIKGRLRALWDNYHDFVTPAQLKKEIDEDFATAYAPYLEEQRQAKKAKSRENFGKNLLADKSPTAPTVPLDLADDGRLMALVGDALAVCGAQAVAGLTADVRKTLSSLGGDKVTLAQVKEVIDEAIKAGYKKNALDAEKATVQGATEQRGVLKGNSPLLETWVRNVFGDAPEQALVEKALAKLPKSRTATITFNQIQQAALDVIEEVRGPELDQKLEGIRGNAEAKLAGTVSNWEALLDESQFSLAADAPRTKLDVATDPALGRLDSAIDAALVGIDPNDIPEKKKALWARLEKMGDSVSLAQVRDELDNLLEGDQKAAAKKNFSKKLLADTSATAPSVPFDLADNSRLMALVGDALAACKAQDVATLTADARQSFKSLGTPTVTLAQVKKVIDQLVTKNFKNLNPDKDGDLETDRKLTETLAKSEEDLADTVGGWDMLLGDSKFNLAMSPRMKLDATLDAALAHLDKGVIPEKKKALWARIEKLGDSVSLAQVREEMDKLFDEDQKKADETDAKATQDGMMNRLAGAVVQELSPPVEPGELDEVVANALKAIGVPDVPKGRHDTIKSEVKLTITARATMPEIEKVLTDALDEPEFKAKVNGSLRPSAGPPGIVFADSNWEDGASDNEIHFTMVVNPLTDELEMWQVNADGSNPVPMDQAEWVKGKVDKQTVWAAPKNPAQAGPLV